MRTKTMPGFTAETLFSPAPRNLYPSRGANHSSSGKGMVSPAFRVTCPGDPALGAWCTALGAGAAFPCWWNSSCMWINAGLAYWPCFSCSYS